MVEANRVGWSSSGRYHNKGEGRKVEFKNDAIDSYLGHVVTKTKRDNDNRQRS